ncbi:MAG: helix-turn-helix domain-containing protein [Polyangiales bacterium]
MIPEVSEPLDLLLEQAFLERQAHELEVCIRVLRLRHGANQQDIEDACGVTRTYLSHLRAGRKEASETLMRLIKVFVISPEAFEYAAEGLPFNKYVAGLFEVAPCREFRSGNFGAKKRYRQDQRFADNTDPIRVTA